MLRERRIGGAAPAMPAPDRPLSFRDQWSLICREPISTSVRHADPRRRTRAPRASAAAEHTKPWRLGSLSGNTLEANPMQTEAPPFLRIGTWQRRFKPESCPVLNLMI